MNLLSCLIINNSRVQSLNEYYSILELTESAMLDEVKKKYRELAKCYHPDLNKSPDAQQKFILVTEAYEIVRNHIERRTEFVC